jgi:hypothetical protein
VQGAAAGTLRQKKYWQADAGKEDAGQEDAGQEDAGQEDAGQEDAGQEDVRNNMNRTLGMHVKESFQYHINSGQDQGTPAVGGMQRVIDGLL